MTRRPFAFSRFCRSACVATVDDLITRKWKCHDPSFSLLRPPISLVTARQSSGKTTALWRLRQGSDWLRFSYMEGEKSMAKNIHVQRLTFVSSYFSRFFLSHRAESRVGGEKLIHMLPFLFLFDELQFETKKQHDNFPKHTVNVARSVPWEIFVLYLRAQGKVKKS